MSVGIPFYMTDPAAIERYVKLTEWADGVIDANQHTSHEEINAHGEHLGLPRFEGETMGDYQQRLIDITRGK